MTVVLDAPIYHWHKVREIAQRNGNVNISEGRGIFFRTFTFSGEDMAVYKAYRAVEKELCY